MNCCDYDCTQGRDCPARSTKRIEQDRRINLKEKCEREIRLMREKLREEYDCGFDGPPD